MEQGLVMETVMRKETSLERECHTETEGIFHSDSLCRCCIVYQAYRQGIPHHHNQCQSQPALLTGCCKSQKLVMLLGREKAPKLAKLLERQLGM